MLQKILLAISVLINLVFVAYRVWPQSENLDEQLHQFTLGIISGMQSQPKCTTQNRVGKAFCNEGALFWSAVRRLQQPQALSADDFTDLPEGQLMWGLALSSTSAAQLQKVETLALSAKQKQYLYDGLGFGFAILRGHDQALVFCENASALKAFCEFGVGRADLFLGLDSSVGGQDEAAGGIFARHFTGQKVPSDSGEGKAKLAAIVGDALRTGKADLLFPFPCLLEQHLVACAER